MNKSYIKAIVLYMSERDTTARKNYWASKTPEERSEIWRLRALKRWSNTSQEDKMKQGKLMLAGKKSVII